MDLKQALDWRYATQVFDKNKKLPEEKLNNILEAARKAPSSMNFQPWKLVVVEDPQKREQIFEAGYHQPKITDAPVLVALMARTEITKDDALKIVEATKEQRNVGDEDVAGLKDMVVGSVPNRTPEWNKRQAYIALGFMLLAAAIEEVDAGPMEGFDPTQVDKILDIDGYTTVTLIALGYRSSEDKYADLPKVRFSAEEVIERV